ncbi:MAG: DUF2207 domain-containing protein [Candidatus Levybacteria bacterium]|nr:DUF2207 domain-containing protein [Candidatus Levybacteria bacterium]
MKYLLILLSLAVFILIPAPLLAAEINTLTDTQKETVDLINSSVVGERVEKFASEIRINTDGTIDVKETIVYFFENERHGIFRNIPFTKHDGTTRYDLAYKFQSITDERGKKYKYEKSKEGEQWVLKIGDPDKTISGTHTYILAYTVRGALGYFEDHDELYWNVTGNGWNVPIKNASVVFTLPKKIDENMVKITCYTGPAGSTKTNCTGTTDGISSTFKTTLFLNSHDGLTVVTGFPKGTTAVLLPEKYIPFFERWYGKITLLGIILIGVFWYLILPVYLIFRWFQKGRDPFVGIAPTATFDSPKIGKRLLTPAETGALLDETVDRRDLFATIVDLARRGHLKISEPKDKEFHLVKTSPKKHDPLLPFETTLYNGIFTSSDEVTLKDVKFYTTATAVESEVYSLLVEHSYFPKNPRTTRNIYYGIGAVAMTTFNFVLAFVCFVFGRIMPRKTLLGAQMAQQSQGLKNFLTSQERQLNFQGNKQMLFEKLLPFAVAFGVEKAWAKRFEGMDLKNPEWYEGSSTSHFNAAVFASHLSNSYSSFSASSTPPSSSSSGFSGGSSGGGGGGGGGGSW